MYDTLMLENKFISFFLFFVITYSASFIGGMVTISFKEPWYSQLIKSNYNPPDWVFAPVWTTLYLLMTIAIWLAWHKNTKDVGLVFVYLIHIFFNTTWSIVFFVMHDIFVALINIIIILLFILFLMNKYKRLNIISYYLMIPYLLWTFYALILNTSLLILN